MQQASHGSARQGPIYDDAMKILADDDLDAVLSLVGLPRGAQPMNTALPGSERRADLLARTTSGIVHVEFVKDRSPDLDLRMMTYRLRLRAQDGVRHTPIAQYVLILGDAVTVPDHYDDVDAERPVIGWTVVRVAQLDPGPMLSNPTTAALAALGRGSQVERARVFAVAATLIARTDPDRARTLLDAATTLASIVLPRPIIDTALKETNMPILIRDTPLGREIYDEGRDEGERETVLRLTRAMLVLRFGDGPRIGSVVERLAVLPDEERLIRITAATDLDELER